MFCQIILLYDGVKRWLKDGLLWFVYGWVVSVDGQYGIGHKQKYGLIQRWRRCNIQATIKYKTNPNNKRHTSNKIWAFKKLFSLIPSNKNKYLFW